MDFYSLLKTHMHNRNHIIGIGIGIVLLVILSFTFASHIFAGQSEELKLTERKQTLETSIASTSEEYQATAEEKASYQQSCEMLAAAESQLRSLNALNAQRRKELSEIEARLEKLRSLK